MSYQLTQGDNILRLADNALIPFDPANRDYAEYLRWLEEGNTPLPADEPAAAVSTEPAPSPAPEVTP